MAVIGKLCMIPPAHFEHQKPNQTKPNKVNMLSSDTNVRENITLLKCSMQQILIRILNGAHCSTQPTKRQKIARIRRRRRSGVHGMLCRDVTSSQFESMFEMKLHCIAFVPLLPITSDTNSRECYFNDRHTLAHKNCWTTFCNNDKTNWMKRY